MTPLGIERSQLNSTVIWMVAHICPISVLSNSSQLNVKLSLINHSQAHLISTSYKVSSCQQHSCTGGNKQNMLNTKHSINTVATCRTVQYYQTKLPLVVNRLDMDPLG